MNELELWILLICGAAWFFLTVYLILDRDQSIKLTSGEIIMLECIMAHNAVPEAVEEFDKLLASKESEEIFKKINKIYLDKKLYKRLK